MRRIIPATLVALTVGLMACGASDHRDSSPPQTEQTATATAPSLSDADQRFVDRFFAKYDSKVVEMERAMEDGHSALKSATTPSQRQLAASYHDVAAHLAAEMAVGIPSITDHSPLASKMFKLFSTATDANSDATNGLRFNDSQMVTKAGHEFALYLELRQQMKATIGR